jgi:hypothetical protein
MAMILVGGRMRIRRKGTDEDKKKGGLARYGRCVALPRSWSISSYSVVGTDKARKYPYHVGL